jgi:hypothetical protein
MSVSCECCVLSGRGLCVGPITRPGESECSVLSVIVEPCTGGLGPIGLSRHEEKFGNTNSQLRSIFGLIGKALLYNDK